MELTLIPQEKLNAVKAILESDEYSPAVQENKDSGLIAENTLADDPWKNLLEDDE